MSIKEFAKSAKDLSRNPLGIIGLFLVLVYGVAGLVTASNGLEHDERKLLIYFLVLFPVVVLIAFYRLVTKHHNKLYAPSDFSDEGNFMKALEVGINKKIDKISDYTEEIDKKISEQPMYRYTKLTEEGKQLILAAHRGNFDLEFFIKERNFNFENVSYQINILSHDYKWIKVSGNEISITDKGNADMNTFEDLVYGRLK